jgi:hypothetical protein
MRDTETIFERLLKICMLDKLHDYVGYVDMISKLALCNKNLYTMCIYDSMNHVPFSLTTIANWNIDRIAKIKHLFVDISSDLHFFPQLFPKLESIRFRDFFDQMIEPGKLPRTLKKIIFGYYFNQTIEPGVLPENLEELIFGSYYDQSFEKDVLPNKLLRLEFEDNFSQWIEELPKNLTKLKIGIWSGDLSLLENLSDLELGSYYNEYIPKGELPRSLKRLKFGDYFNLEIQKGVLPDGLTNLVFGHRFDQRIQENALPASLTDLEFGAKYNQPMDKDFLPESLRSLTISGLFAKKIRDIEFITRLSIFNR